MNKNADELMKKYSPDMPAPANGEWFPMPDNYSKQHVPIFEFPFCINDGSRNFAELIGSTLLGGEGYTVDVSICNIRFVAAAVSPVFQRLFMSLVSNLCVVCHSYISCVVSVHNLYNFNTSHLIMSYLITAHHILQ